MIGLLFSLLVSADICWGVLRDKPKEHLDGKLHLMPSTGIQEAEADSS